MDQTGGRLLGQGVYGCTFDPTPKCANGRAITAIGSHAAVGKVTTDDFREELAIGKAIMALPAAADYFALPTDSCQPSLPIRDPDVTQCKVIMNADGDAKFSMLVMPAAGQQLQRYSQDHARMAGKYKQIFAHILEGAAIYQNAGYIHSDIHPGNILVDEAGVARFIDFGLAFNLATIRKWQDTNLGMRFRPKYLFQAPEIHALRAKFNRIPAATAIQALYDTHWEYRRMEHYFPSRPTALNALTRFMNGVDPYDSVGFVRKHGKKIDSWRIGLCMWILWDELMHWVPITKTAVYAEKELVLKTLRGLTDFDPYTRMTVQEALVCLRGSNVPA